MEALPAVGCLIACQRTTGNPQRLIGSIAEGLLRLRVVSQSKQGGNPRHIYARQVRDIIVCLFANNYDQLAYLDMLLAKALLARDFKLCKPTISANDTTIKGAFNPVVEKIPVVEKVEEIMTSIGDAQSEVNGLSSFAIEMLNIDKILKAVKSGQKILALVDELARTTNPSEGRALVNAFIKILSRHATRSLITTHYNGITAQCNRLRVKGLLVPDGIKVTPENINRYMDYSLVRTTEEEVPTEGLTIAEIFGIDEEFISEAKMMI